MEDQFELELKTDSSFDVVKENNMTIEEEE